MNVELNIFVMFILTAAAAGISIYTSDKKPFLLKNDKEKFLPEFFRAESFYRAWVINLGFAGIAFAMIASPSPFSRLWYVILHPLSLMIFNLIAAAIGGLKLSEDDENPSSHWRKFHVSFYVLISLMMFILSSWAFANYKNYFDLPNNSQKAKLIQLPTSPTAGAEKQGVGACAAKKDK